MILNGIYVAAAMVIFLIFVICRAVKNLRKYRYYREYGYETEAKIIEFRIDNLWKRTETRIYIYEMEYFNGESYTKSRIKSDYLIESIDPFLMNEPLRNETCFILCVKGRNGNLDDLVNNMAEYDDSVILKKEAHFLRYSVFYMLTALLISAMLMILIYMLRN